MARRITRRQADRRLDTHREFPRCEWVESSPLRPDKKPIQCDVDGTFLFHVNRTVHTHIDGRLCGKHWDKFSACEGVVRKRALDRMSAYHSKGDDEMSKKKKSKKVSKKTKLGSTKSVDPKRVKSKGKKKTKSTTTRKPKGAGRTPGRTLKMGVGKTWQHLLAENNKAKVGKRQTDKQLCAFMTKEFPDRDSWEITTTEGVKNIRAFWNRGGWHDSKKPPFKSYEYDAKGDKIPARASAA